MNRGTKRRESLFRTLNTQLRIWDDTLGDKIICPLCWKQFDYESLHSFLSIEHVAPSSVTKLIGENSYETLTCKECNSKYGTKYHGQLKNFLIFQLHQAGKYDKPIKGEISIKDAKLAPLKSNIIFTPQDPIKMIGVPKANAPSATEDTISLLNKMSQEGVTDWSINLKMVYEVNIKKAWSAYIQVAYLLMYIASNCEYSFTKSGNEIRKKISNGNLDDVGPSIIIPHKIGIGGKPWFARIKEPENLRCFWVKIAGNIVILPLPDDDKLTCYSAWQSISKQTNFGLSPNAIHLVFGFNSWEDILEAKKCIILTN